MAELNVWIRLRPDADPAASLNDVMELIDQALQTSDLLAEYRIRYDARQTFPVRHKRYLDVNEPVVTDVHRNLDDLTQDEIDQIADDTGVHL